MNGAIQHLNTWAQYSTSISNLTFLFLKERSVKTKNIPDVKNVHEPAADHSFTTKRQIQETQL